LSRTVRSLCCRRRATSATVNSCVSSSKFIFAKTLACYEDGGAPRLPAPSVESETSRRVGSCRSTRWRWALLAGAFRVSGGVERPPLRAICEQRVHDTTQPAMSGLPRVAAPPPAPADRAYDRTLAALVARGTRLPADPALRWTTVSIFAERHAVEDLDQVPELLWECEEDGREFLRRLRPEFRRQLRQPPKRAAFIARPRLARGGPRARRTVRRARTVGARGDPSPSEPEPPDDLARLAAASTRLWAHVRRREARQKVAA
jgi:hypothetical protein